MTLIDLICTGIILLWLVAVVWAWLQQELNRHPEDEE